VSEAAEAWAWSQAVDSTAKIVLYWLARREINGQTREGASVIAEYSGMPVRAAERAFQRLENDNFISRLKRGVYVLNFGVQTVTSDGSTPANDVGPVPVTSDGSDTHERRLLARADLTTTTATTETQGGMFQDVEWAAVIHESTWTSTMLTVRQIAQLESKYGELDLHESAMAWEDYFASGRGKRRRPKDIYRSFNNWIKNEVRHDATRGGTRKSSELAAINRKGRGGGYSDADRYRT
jgi:hypothetical protein